MYTCLRPPWSQHDRRRNNGLANVARGTTQHRINVALGRQPPTNSFIWVLALGYSALHYNYLWSMGDTTRSRRGQSQLLRRRQASTHGVLVRARGDGRRNAHPSLMVQHAHTQQGGRACV